ncbi:uncharacterized protein RAG0_15441 [Rhynchosporium agropyri]|uniref:Uncharacterized protein n=1 Tax=Rhynchosporium agropyri TaxID=914238 RepID=A0A1E1LL81_9HELO|nr:uncharacterized protein RAG0_15441 [Rhynchosporium agropyri]
MAPSTRYGSAVPGGSQPGLNITHNEAIDNSWVIVSPPTNEIGSLEMGSDSEYDSTSDEDSDLDSIPSGIGATSEIDNDTDFDSNVSSAASNPLESPLPAQPDTSSLPLGRAESYNKSIRPYGVVSQPDHATNTYLTYAARNSDLERLQDFNQHQRENYRALPTGTVGRVLMARLVLADRLWATIVTTETIIGPTNTMTDADGEHSWIDPAPSAENTPAPWIHANMTMVSRSTLRHRPNPISNQINVTFRSFR